MRKHFVALAAVMAASASHPCVPAADSPPPTLIVRLDNDVFGGDGQDGGYTGGLQVSWVSTNLKDFDDPTCLPWIARGIDRHLGWLRPDGVDQKNVVLGLGQKLFTPSDDQAAELLVNDRPYAALLLFGVGYNARSGDRLRASVLRAGIVGPAALGKHVQDGWHKAFGIDRPRGWHHQLRNEPVVQLVHERLRRWGARAGPLGWHWDLIGHWGGSFGNLATYANAGAQWRLGRHLPDDFGSDPLRPAGANTAPTGQAAPSDRWAFHVFVSLDARAVARDLTLDGNTWKTSHSVDKRTLVADLGLGVNVTRGAWKFALASYRRTREFENQQERPVFGSLTVGRRL